MVIGPDGQEYGPANLSTLKQWVGEGRLQAESQLKNNSSGAIVSARDVPGLFDVSAPPQVSGGYAPPMTAAYPRDAGVYPAAAPQEAHWGWGFWKVILGSLAGLVLFFVFGGFGIIFAGYSIYDAVRLKAVSAQSGIVALVISIGATALILVGLVLRYA